MLGMLLLAAVQSASLPKFELVNPRASELFERDPLLGAWALRRFDLNADGWLTTFEAQPALTAFKELADTDGNGRVSVREFELAKKFLVARDGLAVSETAAVEAAVSPPSALHPAR